MSYKFSRRSKERLSTAHPKLQELFNEVIKHIDCTILCGHRDKEEQNAAFDAGRSKLRWPRGNHNALPSNAIDASPYPIDWNDYKRFYFFAGRVIGIADSMGLDVRWGGDWDSDNDFDDQRFNDLVHFELRPKDR